MRTHFSERQLSGTYYKSDYSEWQATSPTRLGNCNVPLSGRGLFLSTFVYKQDKWLTGVGTIVIFQFIGFMRRLRMFVFSKSPFDLIDQFYIWVLGMSQRNLHPNWKLQNVIFQLFNYWFYYIWINDNCRRTTNVAYKLQKLQDRKAS